MEPFVDPYYLVSQNDFNNQGQLVFHSKSLNTDNIHPTTSSNDISENQPTAAIVMNEEALIQALRDLKIDLVSFLIKNNLLKADPSNINCIVFSKNNIAIGITSAQTYCRNFLFHVVSNSNMTKFIVAVPPRGKAKCITNFIFSFV